jgi:hypothetical protein
MNWWRRREREEDLERELRSDLDLEAAEQQESGLSPEEARIAARRAFGNVTLMKEEVRHMWGWTSWEIFLGSPPRVANSAQEPRLCSDRGSDLGAWNRRKHGGLYRS